MTSVSSSPFPLVNSSYISLFSHFVTSLRPFSSYDKFLRGFPSSFIRTLSELLPTFYVSVFYCLSPLIYVTCIQLYRSHLLYPYISTVSKEVNKEISTLGTFSKYILPVSPSFFSLSNSPPNRLTDRYMNLTLGPIPSLSYWRMTLLSYISPWLIVSFMCLIETSLLTLSRTDTEPIRDSSTSITVDDLGPSFTTHSHSPNSHNDFLTRTSTLLALTPFGLFHNVWMTCYTSWVNFNITIDKNTLVL